MVKPADSPNCGVNQAPRLNFSPSGSLVADVKYKAGLDGIVEGALVVVQKVVEMGPTRRRVLADEAGRVIRVHNNNIVLVDFDKKDEEPKEVLVPRGPLAVVDDTPEKKRKSDALTKNGEASGCQPGGWELVGCQSAGGLRYMN